MSLLIGLNPNPLMPKFRLRLVAAGAVVGQPARGRLVRGTDHTLICCGVPVANVWVELMLGRFLPHSQSSPGLGARAIQCPFEHHFCGIEVGRGWQI